MKTTQWFSNRSEEQIQQFIKQAPGKPFYDNYRQEIGTITSAVRCFNDDHHNVKAVEVTILLKEVM